MKPATRAPWAIVRPARAEVNGPSGHRTAIASISTIRSGNASADTSTRVEAGPFVPKNSVYAAGRWRRSATFTDVPMARQQRRVALRPAYVNYMSHDLLLRRRPDPARAAADTGSEEECAVTSGINVTEPVVVTLIHGTFAPEASWVREGSELRKAIAKAFPDAVEFRRFVWSGGNSISARQAAAAELRGQILADPVMAEGARHFLVAHSHGGNIALYALRDPQVRERITGVATLATPFLIAKKRDLGNQGLILFCAGLSVWCFLAAVLIRRFFWPGAELLPPILGASLFLLLTWLIVRHHQRAGTIAEQLQLHPPLHGRLWIGRMSGDEATAGLQTGHLAATVVAQINLFFARAYEWSEQTGTASWWTSVWRLAAGVGVAVLVWSVGKLIGVDDRPAPVLAAFVVGIGIGLLIAVWGLLPQAPRTVVPLAAAVVAPLAFALAILLVLPFGPGVAFYSFLLEMSAEAAPIGTWTIHQYEPRLAGAMSGREAAPSLTHSWVYEQPEVLEDVTTWMHECSALVARSRQPARLS